MSTTFPEAPVANPYVKSLANRVEQHRTSVHALTIVHDDPALMRKLADAQNDQHAITLPVCQADWEASLSELVGWAIDSGIDEVVVVGHSAGLQESYDQAGNAADNSLQAILAAANRTAERVDAAKRHFVGQIMGLSSCPELQHKQCHDSFRLHTLFYVAESGMLLRYEIDSATFRPLG